MPCTNSFRIEAKKYFFLTKDHWFTPRVEQRKLVENSFWLGKKFDLAFIDSPICPNKKSLIHDIHAFGTRLLTNAFVNYVLSPIGGFYHGYFLAKKIIPLAIHKVTDISYNISPKDIQQIKAHFVGCMEGGVAATSSFTTFSLLFRGLLKAYFLAQDKDVIQGNALFNKTWWKVFSFSLLAIYNLVFTYRDSIDSEDCGYWEHIKDLGLPQQIAHDFLAKHYLGIHTKEATTLDSLNSSSDSGKIKRFTKDDYASGGEQFRSELKKWIDESLFVFWAEQARKRINEFKEKQDSSKTLSCPQDSDAEIKLYFQESIYLACAEYSFNLAHDFDNHIQSPCFFQEQLLLRSHEKKSLCKQEALNDLKEGLQYLEKVSFFRDIEIVKKSLIKMSQLFSNTEKVLEYGDFLNCIEVSYFQSKNKVHNEFFRQLNPNYRLNERSYKLADIHAKKVFRALLTLKIYQDKGI